MNKDNMLIQAAEHGLTPVVKRLLREESIDVHAENDEALRWASSNGYLDIMALLLEKGANVHAKDDWALRWASEKGHSEVVALLLKAGAK